MVELINKNTNQKLMAMILGEISYLEDRYIIYCIKRSKEDTNVFVSKLVKNSQGYTIDDDFLNGEKQILDGIVKRLLNKESKNVLEKDGFLINKFVSLEGIHYFDIEKCYVATVPSFFIKDCLIFYDLVSKKLLEQPIVEVIDDKRKFNDGFVSNIVVIGLGVTVILFSLFIVGQILLS